MGDDAFFVYEDPPPRAKRNSFDWAALELVAKRARGRWIRLVEPRRVGFASNVRKRLGPEFEAAQRAVPAAEGPNSHWIYVRHVVEDDET